MARRDPRSHEAPWLPCPDCGKRTWPNRQAARRAAIVTDHAERMRIYKACDRHGYHIGHHPKWLRQWDR